MPTVICQCLPCRCMSIHLLLLYYIYRVNRHSFIKPTTAEIQVWRNRAVPPG
ncbi:hypothetical protein GMOD_00002719 [Pyrenophora seminiperda CCB06]|uniref:Uncharacterized protein n=1 Tax=Pyrenophora seminiperda CCB06 TaxID=1302712 RepID=A0A3M7M2Y9_9PLEO|nr:hypothetical protein GMOD_00002719 [Pyrenophora seminiperda CCB06]